MQDEVIDPHACRFSGRHGWAISSSPKTLTGVGRDERFADEVGIDLRKVP